MSRMKRAFGVAAAAALLVLAGCSSSSSPETDVSDVTPAPVLDWEAADAFTGVAALDGPSRCTGTLIDTGVDDGPAYILTNGHCLGMDFRGANEVMENEEGYGQATSFAFHDVAEADRVSVPMVTFEYATMYSIDLGIARLDATLGELRSQGI